MGKDIEHNVSGRTDSVGPEKQVATKDADDALEFLRSQDETAVFDDVSEKKLMRKVDGMLMPLMFMCNYLQYTDKTLSKYFDRASPSLTNDICSQLCRRYGYH